jgi:hypothetical protein
MPRTGWLVIGAVLAVGILGGAINARGPFGAHPSLSYVQFLADFQAGHVGRIVQWRDQLEVADGSRLLLVVVPADADLGSDLALARRAGGVGISHETIPDDWLGSYAPWVPGLILAAGALIWVGALARARRVSATGPVGAAAS